jgi:integrase
VLVEQEQQIVYSNFLDSLRADETKRKYAYSLSKYQEFLGLKDVNELLLDNNVRTIENAIISYILKMRKEGYSFSSLNTRLAAIVHFYTMNDIVINRKKIGKYLGEDIKTVRDRAYTIEEIKKIVDACDLKYKIVVTLMVSSGCRIGAIASLKIKDTKYIEKQRLHQIFFCTNTGDEYYSFCTPECSNYIMEYLQYRESCGERITLESPLIRDDFIQDDLDHVRDPKHVTTHTFEYYLRNILIKTGIRIPTPQTYRGSKKKMRKEISQNHGFRKYFNTVCVESDMNIVSKELLMGHRQSLGLEKSYYRPTSDKLLNEYLKVVDILTVNDENRLKLENTSLKQKQKAQEMRLSSLEERFEKIVSK